MRRIRLVIQYDGTNYVGWQSQHNGVSVQSTMERELARILGEDVTLTASGRTDSGVHAAAQVAHFDTSARIPADKIPYALNVSLPPDIRVLYGDEPLQPQNGEFGFHARYDVKKKHYRYCIINTKHNSVFLRNTALFVHCNLDFDKMNCAAKQILGTHDFSAFRTEGSVFRTTTRTVYRSEWARNGDYLCYDICGSGFLYNMVRIIVGTMLEIGKGTREPDCINEAFACGNRSILGATAPAHGLIMSRVEYDGFDTDSVVTIDGAAIYGKN